MQNVPTELFGIFSQFLSLQDILSLATSNKTIKEKFLDEEVNVQLANYYGFPYSLNLGQLKEYEDMEINQRLILAAKIGDLRVVNKMIELDADDFDEAMIKAARYGHEIIVDRMVDLDAERFNFAMAAAARGGYEKLVDKFIKLGAKNIDHAMVSASKGGHEKIIDKLINLGANNFEDAFYAAIAGRQEKIISRFQFPEVNTNRAFLAAAKKQDIEYLKRYDKNISSDIYNTALHFAAQNGNEKMMDWLLERGAKYSNVAIISATIGGHLNILRKIITRNGKEDYQQLYPRVMYMAAEHGHIEIVEFYIEKSLPFNANDLLVYAAMSGNKKIIEIALRYKVTSYQKAMIEATKKGNIKTVKTMIELGGRNFEEATIAAIEYNRLTLLNMFLDKYEVKITNNLLPKATRPGYRRIMKTLIQHGAKNLNEALRAAASNSNLNSVKFLIESGADDFEGAMKKAMKYYDSSDKDLIEYLEKFL